MAQRVHADAAIAARRRRRALLQTETPTTTEPPETSAAADAVDACNGGGGGGGGKGAEQAAGMLGLASQASRRAPLSSTLLEVGCVRVAYPVDRRRLERVWFQKVCVKR